jgi:putative endopeptidase
MSLEQQTNKPQNDFYRYVNDDWHSVNSIPPEYSSWGVFHELNNSNLSIQKQILEHTDNTKLSRFFAKCMDETSRSSTELRSFIASLSGCSLTEAVIRLHELGVGPLFGCYASQDRKDATQMIATIGGAQMGLPDRDYYLEERHAALLGKYSDYMLKLLTAWYGDESKASSMRDTVLEVETHLAKHSITKENRRKPELTYNMRNIAELGACIDWAEYFRRRVPAAIAAVNVSHPPFLACLQDISREKLDAYFEFTLVNYFASYLSVDLENIKFDFFGRTLSGQKEQKPRWKRSLGVVNSYLGEELGQEYVKENFPDIRKQQVLAMVSHLKIALAEIIGEIDWMGTETKAAARVKLDKMTPLIGFPDKWKDTSGLAIGETTSLAEDILNASRFLEIREMKKIGNLVDAQEWHMTPQTVNAYYSPQKNQIVFPAAILQEPFFYLGTNIQQLAKSYGAIGAVIGHEITHGFDDSGRKFDHNGNQKDWWTEEDATRFQAKAQKIVDQYQKCVFFGENLNGELTQGENIADIGGLKMAYKAYGNACKALNKHGSDPDYCEFFKSWANVWRTMITEEAAKLRIQTDPHSPGVFRVNQVLKNIPEFRDAFDVKKDDGMYLEEPAIVW